MENHSSTSGRRDNMSTNILNCYLGGVSMEDPQHTPQHYGLIQSIQAPATSGLTLLLLF